ncbi:hypothetical protein BJ165DRAFT_407225 [Panaeolus papilionaceus]|nr:hypothetical protein BJ165DRAFT_407225 [Panaeolus papilionaceus]
MFPVSDFNFVVAGIATFAATVGYACSRKLISSQTSSDTLEETTRESAPSSKSQEHVHSQNPVMPSSSGTSILQTLMNAAPAAYTLTRRGSMKRKAPHDGFDEDVQRKLEYPHNLANLYPNKRSRTPSTESDCSEAPPPSVTPATTLDSIMSQTVDHDMEIQIISDEPQAIVDTPATEPPETPSPFMQSPPTPRAPSPVLATQPCETREVSPQLHYPPTPVPITAEEVKESTSNVEAAPEVSATQPVTPEPEAPSTEDVHIAEIPKEESGFVLTPAKFVFASQTITALVAAPEVSTSDVAKQEARLDFNAPRFGFFAVPQTPKPATPAFKAFSTPNKGFAAFAGSSSPFTSKVHETATTKSIWTVDVGLPSQQVEPESNAVDSFAALFDSPECALTSTKSATSILPTTYKHVTGEEDESVDAELKGVRLFVKRGNKGFGDGVAGQVKILTNNETSGQRILFRREPLLKISMNVRVGAAVRCTYTPEENVVRLVLKEAVESEGGLEKQELVIYAIKPGRHCSKDDFKEFATMLHQTVQSKSALSAPPTPKVQPARPVARVS